LGSGYKHLLIQPHPDGRLSYSKATFESSYGTVTSGWERKDGKLIINVRIPANTTAEIILPANSIEDVSEGGKALAQSTILKDVKASDGKLVINAGSGQYIFEIQ
jgi:alpha-L-rhamnosidase